MLDNKKEYFKLRKKEVLQDIRNTARSFVEDEACVDRFVSTAWAIASRHLSSAEYLKTEDQDSLVELQWIAANAVRIVTVFEHMRRAYSNGTLTQEKLSHLINLIDQVDNSVEITGDCTKERRKNGKVYLKSTLCAIVGGMLGSALSLALRYLVFALSLL